MADTRDVDKTPLLSYTEVYDSETEGTKEMKEERNEHPIDSDENTSEDVLIDLNRLYADSVRDLNRLFPDVGVRRFLRDVKMNQKGVERFLEKIEKDS